MSSKLSLSLIAALALSAAATGGARANSIPTRSDDSSGRPKPSTNEEITDLEKDNPHSVDNRKRITSRHRTTNDEINAGETGDPNSVDYRNRFEPHSTSNEEIGAAKSQNAGNE